MDWEPSNDHTFPIRT